MIGLLSDHCVSKLTTKRNVGLYLPSGSKALYYWVKEGTGEGFKESRNM